MSCTRSVGVSMTTTLKLGGDDVMHTVSGHASIGNNYIWW